MTDDTEGELLLRYRPWLRKIAREMLSSHEQRFTEDLAQEGWIAVWRELSNNQDFSWLMTCARNRMRNVIRDSHAQRRDERQYLWVDDITEYWDDGDTFGDVELAYHHGEIARAIDTLSHEDKQYILRRFWHNWPPAALEIQYDWPRQIIWPRCRKQLSDQLSHLRQEAADNAER